jgi:hypothetical protein
MSLQSVTGFSFVAVFERLMPFVLAKPGSMLFVADDFSLTDDPGRKALTTDLYFKLLDKIFRFKGGKETKLADELAAAERIASLLQRVSYLQDNGELTKEHGRVVAWACAKTLNVIPPEQLVMQKETILQLAIVVGIAKEAIHAYSRLALTAIAFSAFHKEKFYKCYVSFGAAPLDQKANSQLVFVPKASKVSSLMAQVNSRSQIVVVKTIQGVAFLLRWFSASFVQDRVDGHFAITPKKTLEGEALQKFKKRYFSHANKEVAVLARHFVKIETNLTQHLLNGALHYRTWQTAHGELSKRINSVASIELKALASIKKFIEEVDVPAGAMWGTRDDEIARMKGFLKVIRQEIQPHEEALNLFYKALYQGTYRGGKVGGTIDPKITYSLLGFAPVGHLITPENFARFSLMADEEHDVLAADDNKLKNRMLAGVSASIPVPHLHGQPAAYKALPAPETAADGGAAGLIAALGAPLQAPAARGTAGLVAALVAPLVDAPALVAPLVDAPALVAPLVDAPASVKTPKERLEAILKLRKLPFAQIKYLDRVADWFTKPDEMLLQPKYKDRTKEGKRHALSIHTFSLHVDLYWGGPYSRQGLWKGNLHFLIPGALNGQKGAFEACFLPGGECFHRCFNPMRDEEFFAEWYNTEFPTLTEGAKVKKPGGKEVPLKASDNDKVAIDDLGVITITMENGNVIELIRPQ